MDFHLDSTLDYIINSPYYQLSVIRCSCLVTVHTATIPRGVSVHYARKSRDIQRAKLCSMHNFCALRSKLLSAAYKAVYSNLKWFRLIVPRILSYGIKQWSKKNDKKRKKFSEIDQKKYQDIRMNEKTTDKSTNYSMEILLKMQ